MNDELKTFLIKAGVWLTGGAGLMVGIWFLSVAVIASLQKPVNPNSVVGAPSAELKGAKTERVVTAPVRAYTTPTKKELNLPAPVVGDPNEHVVAATQVKGDLRPQTVTTTLNTATGEAQTFVRQDPYPWFAVEARGEARLSIGYRYDGAGLPKQVVRLGLQQDLIRIKALTAGVTATVDDDGHSFAGVGIAYKW